MADHSNVSNDKFGIDDEVVKKIISQEVLLPNSCNSDILFASDYDDEDENDADDDFEEDDEDLFDEDELDEEGYEEDFDFDEDEDEEEEEEFG